MNWGKMTTGLKWMALVVLSCGAATSGQPPESVPGVEARADRVLRAMGEWLSAAEVFTFRADVTYDSLTSDGQMIQYGGVADVWVQRPGLLRVEFRGDEEHRQIICDGSKFVIFGLAMGLYAVTEVPAEIGAAVDMVFEKYGFSVPIAEWLRGDLRDYARDLVLDGEGTKGYFNRGYIEQLWTRHQSGMSDFGTELWILMMFNLWHRRFAEIPAAAASPRG